VTLFSRSSRKVLANIAFGLGVIWGVAGAFALLFGTQLTFPLLPPLGLDRVAPIPSLAVAVGLFLLGAYLGRAPADHGATSGGSVTDGEDLIGLNAGDAHAGMPQRTPTPISVRPLNRRDER
jgi:hypothetical protein